MGGTILENTAKIYWDTLPTEDPNIILTGGAPGSDGSEDRDYGAVEENEIFDQNTDDAQDTERVVINANSISGVVYVDLDLSGDFSAGDTFIPGVTLTLTGTDLNGNTINRTTTTDINGSYTFTNVSAGTYAVTETQPTLYVDALETAGTPFGGVVSNAVNSNDITNIVIPEQQSQAGIDYNFGEVQSASISGIVYVDVDASQTYSSGDIGIEGVVVTLTGTDAASQPVSLTTVTGIGGVYVFVGLRPGTYTITENQPSGYLDGVDTAGTLGGDVVVPDSDTIENIDVTAGDNGIDYNFGELRPSSLSGFVYHDANNNGTFNPGEAPIAGVTVALSGTDYLGNVVSASVLTDASGAYHFNALLPGEYVITETQPTAYLDGKDTIGTPGGSPGNDVFTNINLSENFNGVNNNFGELVPATLRGFVYVDADNDGIFDAGETPLAGVEVVLTGTDDLGGVNLTAFTDATGAYIFNDLRPGSYVLNETQPVTPAFPIDYLDGKETVGSTGGTVNNTTDSNTIGNIFLVSGNQSVGNNFGELIPSTLAGTVYEDLNNNGAIDSGENGIPDVIVRLTGTDDRGNTIDTTTTVTTDANGNYLFTGLRPGQYVITETQPATYLDGKDTIGTPGGTTGNDVFSNVNVTSGTVGVNNNFGELPPSSISGFVYNDSNNDGVYDTPGEAPIPSVSVKLTGTDDLGNAVELFATTDGTGAYSFTNLRPGDYVIEETQPAGFLDGIDTPGTNGASLGLLNDRIAVSFSIANNNSTDNNFGELRPSSISGHVFIDANNDGVHDLLEVPVPGVEIRLTGIDDLGNVVSLVTTTNFLGHYEFTNLRPGAYVLTEVQPEQLLDGKDSLGTQGGIALNDRFTFTLTENVNGTENDFGELRPASISGYVYDDRNNNGVLEPGEPGIPGVTILITGVDDLGNAVSRTTVTNALGQFLFDRLRPGTYNLFEVQPAGYNDGIDTAGTKGGTVGNDFIGSIVLDQGDNAELYLFGEHRIIIPPKPKPPGPSPDDGDGDEPIPFAFDAFNNFSIRPDSFRAPGLFQLPSESLRFPVLPLAPIYTGSANPGATLVVELYGAYGSRVGHTTVLADAGGNWIANFPSSTLLDTPTSVRVTQTNVPYAFGSGLGKNLRVYYAPVGLNPGQFVSLSSDVGQTFSEGAPLLGGLDLSNPLQLGAAKYGSEMLPAGGVASGY
ncbi:SdrD B-like domain-containing protein [Roseimicrobium sp. ORNL1]|uniref:SdrD B-like domain-containing protein n=1 Tax=Roseimicrobium sp. ORNL1 TaxID=2711231 RepID=UPI0013E0F5B0|nr:SdrD B-like domain-containing protein [Roseimicrobium sp. ORNL1]QIF03840.1 hypothetical protein G5S37_20705 [Roseimicrobium sp. ORNL1]